VSTETVLSCLRHSGSPRGHGIFDLTMPTSKIAADVVSVEDS